MTRRRRYILPQIKGAAHSEEPFAYDESTVQKVGIKSTDVILEIGPGTGNLSKKLLEAGKMVIAVELDSRMVLELHCRFQCTPYSNRLKGICQMFEVFFYYVFETFCQQSRTGSTNPRNCKIWSKIMYLESGQPGAELHLKVKLDPDPRYVFQFEDVTMLSPQIVQLQGSIKQPIFSCKFSQDSSGILAFSSQIMQVVSWASTWFVLCKIIPNSMHVKFPWILRGWWLCSFLFSIFCTALHTYLRIRYRGQFRIQDYMDIIALLASIFLFGICIQGKTGLILHTFQIQKGFSIRKIYSSPTRYLFLAQPIVCCWD